jgi:hypothetical protein
MIARISAHRTYCKGASCKGTVGKGAVCKVAIAIAVLAGMMGTVSLTSNAVDTVPFVAPPLTSNGVDTVPLVAPPITALRMNTSVEDDHINNAGGLGNRKLGGLGDAGAVKGAVKGALNLEDLGAFGAADENASKDASKVPADSGLKFEKASQNKQGQLLHNSNYLTSSNECLTASQLAQVKEQELKGRDTKGTNEILNEKAKTDIHEKEGQILMRNKGKDEEGQLRKSRTSMLQSSSDGLTKSQEAYCAEQMNEHLNKIGLNNNLNAKQDELKAQIIREKQESKGFIRSGVSKVGSGLCWAGSGLKCGLSYINPLNLVPSVCSASCAEEEEAPDRAFENTGGIIHPKKRG